MRSTYLRKLRENQLGQNTWQSTKETWILIWGSVNEKSFAAFLFSPYCYILTCIDCQTVTCTAYHRMFLIVQQDGPNASASHARRRNAEACYSVYHEFAAFNKIKEYSWKWKITPWMTIVVCHIQNYSQECVCIASESFVLLFSWFVAVQPTIKLYLDAGVLMLPRQKIEHHPDLIIQAGMWRKSRSQQQGRRCDVSSRDAVVDSLIHTLLGFPD